MRTKIGNAFAGVSIAFAVVVVLSCLLFATGCARTDMAEGLSAPIQNDPPAEDNPKIKIIELGSGRYRVIDTEVGMVCAGSPNAIDCLPYSEMSGRVYQ